MSDEQLEERITRLAFDGDALQVSRILWRLKAGLPEGTAVALRGSVVTSKRWQDGKPFDAGGHAALVTWT